MDKRKLAAALALGGSIAIGSLFTGGGDPVSGSYRGGYYGGGGSYRGGAIVDTFRLLVQDADLPNTVALTDGLIEADSYYDQVNENAANETIMRYGSISGSVPTTATYDALGGYTYKTTEDNTAMPPRMSFIAFNVDGLTEGHRVEEAFICINQMALTDLDILTGAVYVRLDTVIADYAALNSTSAYPLDLSWLDTSRNEVDITHSEAWAPTIAAREDMHDWGPRGIGYAPATKWTWAVDGTVAAKLDVTDPVQQALDNGLLTDTGGWLIFTIYQVGTPVNYTGWGWGANTTNAPGGNPCLVIETTSQRGARAWGTGELPFLMTFDDNHWDHDTWYASLNDSGLIAHSLVTKLYVDQGTPLRMDVDSLALANTGQTKFLHHTVNHPALGGLTVAGELDFEIGRWWMTAAESFPSGGIDTTSIVDFAWSVNGPDSVYSIGAIETMVDFGYRSSRAAGAGTWTPIGDIGVGGTGVVTYMSWEAPVNMYMYGAFNGLYGGAASDKTEAEIKELLTDKIDLYYTNYGKAALVAFGHDWDQDGITLANIEYVTGLVNQLNGVRHMSLDDILGRRDAARIDPATIAAMDILTTDSTAIKASAAIHDSLISLTGHDNMLEVWVGPKGN